MLGFVADRLRSEQPYKNVTLCCATHVGKRGRTDCNYGGTRRSLGRRLYSRQTDSTAYSAGHRLSKSGAIVHQSSSTGLCNAVKFFGAYRALAADACDELVFAAAQQARMRERRLLFV
jgi:hypothetical protein